MNKSKYETYLGNTENNNGISMISSKSKTVVILGMHRSGTSVVAGVIKNLGVNMGEKLLGKSWSNPLGHFEDEDFIQLNIRILGSAGGSWDSPPDYENICSQKKKYESEIKDLLQTKNRTNLWGWKDPRTSLTIELYIPYLRKPHIIVAHRDEENVIKSLGRRNGMTEEYARKLTRIYQSRIQDFLHHHPELPVLHVSYEDFLDNPHTMVQKVIRFLALEQDGESYRRAVSLVRPNDKLRKISNFMRVQSGAKQFFRWPAKRLYHFLIKKRRR